MSTISNLMSKDLKTVSGDTAVTEAASQMRNNRIGSLLIQQNGNISGIVTDTDIIRRAVAETKDLSQTSVESIMTSPLITIESARCIRDAQDMMSDNRIRHLVVCEAEKIVGIISVRDLLVYYRSVSEPKISQD